MMKLDRDRPLIDAVRAPRDSYKGMRVHTRRSMGQNPGIGVSSSTRYS